MRLNRQDGGLSRPPLRMYEGAEREAGSRTVRHPAAHPGPGQGSSRAHWGSPVCWAPSRTGADPPSALCPSLSSHKGLWTVFLFSAGQTKAQRHPSPGPQGNSTTWARCLWLEARVLPISSPAHLQDIPGLDTMHTQSLPDCTTALENGRGAPAVGMGHRRLRSGQANATKSHHLAGPGQHGKGLGAWIPLDGRRPHAQKVPSYLRSTWNGGELSSVSYPPPCTAASLTVSGPRGPCL